MEKQEQIQYLLRQYISNAATPAEQNQLMTALGAADYDEEELLQMLDSIAHTSPADDTYDAEYWKPVLRRILKAEQAKVIPITPHRLLTNKIWRRIAVAASVILILGAGYWFFVRESSDVNRDEPVAVLPSDVKAPETNRAMITLANGEKVYLDSAVNGTLAIQGNINVIKTADGQIVYDAGKISPTGGDLEGAYNTLANPRGSKVIDMTLADGSRVWLNAGSSVTYPVAFIGNERKVSITGEAYFEVTHDAKKPFKVSKGEMEVIVLGTHFNVNAYDDEETIKVTLLEGSVQVSAPFAKNLAPSAVKIKPGQQAVLTPNSPLTIHHPDLNGVMAWQKGLFEFNNTDLSTIMRQVSRWYDVDIIYETPPRDAKFGGGLSRQLPLSNVLKLLEANGVKFTLEGKTLKVRP